MPNHPGHDHPGHDHGGRAAALLAPLLFIVALLVSPGEARPQAAEAPAARAVTAGPIVLQGRAETDRPELPGHMGPLHVRAAGGRGVPAAEPADTVPAGVEPLFTKRDAWFAGGFLLGTAALAPLDIAVAEAVQDSVIQADRVLSGGAGFFRWMGFPGVVLVSGGLYAGGWALNEPEVADIGLHTTEAILIAEAVTIAAKAVIGRARPRLDTGDPYNLDLFRGFTHDDFQSFPSGHTTGAFATAAALTTEISRHHPEAKWWVGTLMFGGATLMGVSRLYHNEHWASDVMMGAAIGSFGGWKVVRYMHTHPENRLNRWLLPRGALPTPHGDLMVVWSLPAPR